MKITKICSYNLKKKVFIFINEKKLINYKFRVENASMKLHRIHYIFHLVAINLFDNKQRLKYFQKLY